MNREAYSMNRWIRWARQLRLKHGRTVLRRSGAPMVLARRPAAGAALFRMAGSPIHINLRPRFAVTFAVAAPAPLSVMAQAALALPVHSQAVSGLAELARVQRRDWFQVKREAVTRLQPEPPPAGAHRPGFVPPALATRFVAAPERRAALPAPLPRTLYRRARMWTRKPAAARAAVELPGRVRLRARRTEMPAPAVRALAAAAPLRREIPSAAAPPAGSQLHGPPAPPAAVPAINVEALTSQVIQQLDRRLIAYRERLGRS